MRTRILRGLRSTLAAAVLVAGGAAWAGTGDGSKSFPDAWYFLNNGQRYDTLRALEGKPAPALSIDTWIGTETTVAANKGKVVVVDFWATWCGPCMASIPHNVELVKKYGDQGLVFIGVHDSNSGWDQADSVVKDKGINYPVGRDKTGGQSTKDYGLQFWPTYIAIDRNGVIRAAGLTPDKVEDVVKVLLAEQGSAAATQASGASEFAPEFYLGGANRPKAFRDAEGKQAPALHAASWLGSAPAGASGDKPLTGGVTVVTFVSPSLTPSMAELEKLAAIDKEFGAQGVTTFGISDDRHEGAWAKMQAFAKAKKLTLPIMQDTVQTKNGGATPVRVSITAAAYGIDYYPATVVIDRAGKIRAAGIRADKLKPVIEKLLGETVSDKPGGAAVSGDNKKD